MSQELLNQVIKSPELDNVIMYLSAVQGGFKGTYDEYFFDKVMEAEYIERVSKFLSNSVKKKDYIDRIPKYSTFDIQVNAFCRNLYYLGYTIQFHKGGLIGLIKLFDGFLDKYTNNANAISPLDDYRDIRDAMKRWWHREELEDHERESLSKLLLDGAKRHEIINWIWHVKGHSSPNITDQIAYYGVVDMRQGFDRDMRAYHHTVQRYGFDISLEDMIELWKTNDRAIINLVRTKHPEVRFVNQTMIFN